VAGDVSRILRVEIAEVNRIQFVLFGRHNRTFRPYVTTIHGILIPVLSFQLLDLIKCIMWLAWERILAQFSVGKNA
jgi:hypothetical protein